MGNGSQRGELLLICNAVIYMTFSTALLVLHCTVSLKEQVVVADIKCLNPKKPFPNRADKLMVSFLKNSIVCHSMGKFIFIFHIVFVHSVQS